jgi:peptide/nickel transport system permease protein
MTSYILRRILLAVPTLIGVLVLLFILFFWIASPEKIARRVLGEKARADSVQEWIKKKGYDKPRFYNEQAQGIHRLTDTLFVSYLGKTLTFQFGESDLDNIPIAMKLRDGLGPSLLLSVPVFLAGTALGLLLALMVTYFRDTYIDRAGLVACVIGMSLVYFVYILGGQYLIGKTLRWFPISGWSSIHPFHFLALPVVVGVVSGLGESVRFYRSVMLNEVHADYIRTARAKGLGEGAILFRHLLRNALLPILTQLVMAIPFLFTGSLLLESFFGIPGVGRLTVISLLNNDFSTASAMVYLGSLLYIAGNLLTDISYTIADPRVKLS